MFNSKSKILVIAPHLDDEALGMGGTISYLKSKGCSVHVVFAAFRKYNGRTTKSSINNDKKESMLAKKILGYDKISFLNLSDERLQFDFNKLIMGLEKIVKKEKPDTIFCCFYGDNNQDHRSVFDASRIVFRWKNNVKNVFLYETPSSTEISPAIQNNQFVPNFYINIEKYLENKIKAFYCYKSEISALPSSRNKEGIINYAKFRGMSSGLKAAEAFMSLRQVI